MKNLENATELYEMINSGKLMEGFEKFYHPDVVMQETGEAPRKGKDLNREYEQRSLRLGGLFSHALYPQYSFWRGCFSAGCSGILSSGCACCSRSS